MDNADNRASIVLEIGSRLTRVGISGEDRPRHILNSNLTIAAGEEGCFGAEFVTSQGDFAMIELLNRVFDSVVEVPGQGTRVTCIVDYSFPQRLVRAIYDHLFSVLKASSVLLLASPQASCFGFGVDTALVIDIGYSAIRLVPFVDGFRVVHAQKIIPGGLRGALEAVAGMVLRKSGGRSQKSLAGDEADSLLDLFTGLGYGGPLTGARGRLFRPLVGAGAEGAGDARKQAEEGGAAGGGRTLVGDAVAWLYQSLGMRECKHCASPSSSSFGAEDVIVHLLLHGAAADAQEPEGEEERDLAGAACLFEEAAALLRSLGAVQRASVLDSVLVVGGAACLGAVRKNIRSGLPRSAADAFPGLQAANVHVLMSPFSPALVSWVGGSLASLLQHQHHSQMVSAEQYGKVGPQSVPDFDAIAFGTSAGRGELCGLTSRKAAESVCVSSERRGKLSLS